MSAQGRTWATLSRTAAVRVTARRPGLEADTRLSSMTTTWTESDPAAVTLSIADPWAPGEPVVWSIARNLLVAAHLPGMHGEIVGLGNARVRCSNGETNLWLGTAEGAAAIAVASEVVFALLSDAARIAPLGEAEARIYADAIDAELAALLDGAA